MQATAYGTYVLTPTEFSYRYTEPSVFTITPSSITVSHKLPWEGMRTFGVSREGSAVRLRSQTGAQGFLFPPEGLTYSDAGTGTFVGKRRVPTHRRGVTSNRWVRTHGATRRSREAPNSVAVQFLRSSAHLQNAHMDMQPPPSGDAPQTACPSSEPEARL